MRNCKIALGQLASGTDRAANLKRMEEMTAEAAAQHADMIIFPEHADYIGSDPVPVPGELTEFYSRLASKYQIWLHAGSLSEKYCADSDDSERSDSKDAVSENNDFEASLSAASGTETADADTSDAEKCREKSGNTTLVFSPDGSLQARYSKIHMFDVDVMDGPSYRESDKIVPGNQIVRFETGFAQIGLSICYDLRFPIMYQQMAHAGAEILIISANFTAVTGAAHWETLLRARAIENTCYVLACNQCGVNGAFPSYGHSMIIDPWGRILASADGSEQLVIADLDAAELDKVRKEIPCLQNETLV